MNKYNSKIAKMLKWLTRVPADRCFGFTISATTTLYSCPAEQVTERLRSHEEQHKRQYQAYGSRVKFWWAYLKANVKYGYRDNPFEVAARRAENEPL